VHHAPPDSTTSNAVARPSLAMTDRAPGASWGADRQDLEGQLVAGVADGARRARGDRRGRSAPS
jgi:hypothetical protein